MEKEEDQTLAKNPDGEEEDTAMADALENPKTTADDSSGSDDSSDSESDSEDEAQQKLELQNLELELSNNPSNYDTHVQYIKVLRKMSEIEKLRQAREAMNEIFPLTPAMWREWARDETCLLNEPGAFLAIEKIYERGVSDYLSVPLWCDYLKFVQEKNPSVCECSPDGILKARNLFERAITAAGLHVAEGSKIWKAYREFEQAIFLSIDEANIEEKEKQIQRIRSIFHRQLSVPLADLRSTLLAYKSWEVEQGNALDVESSDVDGISSNVASAYQKALEMYNARAHYEEQISRQDISDSEKFQQFMIYLKFEQSSGDPARVQLLYERAVTDFPVSSDLWLDYTRYLDKTLKVGNVIRDVYARATQNCPWVGELWVRSLLSLERCRASEKQIFDVFEKSLLCTFSTLEEYLDLFLTRVDGLRRRILSTDEKDGVLDFSLIRETFQRASDYLSQHMKNTDSLMRLHAYWARLELNLGKDLAAAHRVWESLLKLCGTMLEAWQGYIAMEIETGHISEARSIFKRCYSKRFMGTGSEDICHAWLRFEREYGTLEDFDRAVQKVTPRLEELQLFRLQQESIAHPEPIDQKEHSLKKSGREKRKPGSNISNGQSPAKRQKSTAQIPKKVHENEKEKMQNLAEVNEAEETKSKVEKPERTNEQQMKDSVPGKRRGYTDECTAFISNINPNATYDDLRQFFSDEGIASIRILNDKFTGKSRGLAYVDFTDDTHLAAALAKNKQMLLGKKLSILRSNPKQKKESSGHNTPLGHAQKSNQTRKVGGSTSEESVETSKESRPPREPHFATRNRNDDIQFKGKNTFAVPRNVRPLGVPANKPKSDEGEDTNPKSNDEFRKMFIKN
ncbi:hypothetical protein LWI29_031902 [Acer saccharum]|uniref:RRM domain-containing protein n=1 Tax=Acer saccharum TaxID=4024 RepID=A0AA39VU58_ACESA|nr:hypothetical protein LWI29_031902 [Acer saccharum]KAK1569104.1 hypothetical protein Q3G72_032551 [Acer saccharum]